MDSFADENVVAKTEGVMVMGNHITIWYIHAGSFFQAYLTTNFLRDLLPVGTCELGAYCLEWQRKQTPRVATE